MTTSAIKYLRMYLHVPHGPRRAIGYLSQYGDMLRTSFDESYIGDPQRPTLSLRLVGETDAATQAILRAPRDARLVSNNGRWPSFFSNLLPEGHNRDRLARERHCATTDEFELLAAAGHDLMGALEVEPVPAQEGIPENVHAWHTALGLEPVEPGFVDEPVEDAAAIPGVVTKFSAVHDGRRYVVRRHNQAGSVILKLPSTRHPDLVHNEFSGYKMCAALGLDCAEAEIVPAHGAELPVEVPFSELLAVKRFDRGPQGQRIHMEEFTQVLGLLPEKKYGPLSSYSQMLLVLNSFSNRPGADVKEFIGRLVAFILMGNTDAHLKNWALVYPDSRTPILSPVYDPACISAFFLDEPDLRVYAVNRKIDGTMRAFSWDDLEQLITAAKITRKTALLKYAKSLVSQAKAEWPAILKTAPDNVRLSVTERLAGGTRLAR